MDLRISTDIAAEILATDEVCQFIKLEDQDDGPELLLVEQMISSVRTHFERRTGLSFAPRTYEAFFRRSESPFILPVAPVISVDKVETIDYLGTKTEQTLNEGYYEVCENGKRYFIRVANGDYDVIDANEVAA